MGSVLGAFKLILGGVGLIQEVHRGGKCFRGIQIDFKGGIGLIQGVDGVGSVLEAYLYYLNIHFK